MNELLKKKLDLAKELEAKKFRELEAKEDAKIKKENLAKQYEEQKRVEIENAQERARVIQYGIQCESIKNIIKTEHSDWNEWQIENEMRNRLLKLYHEKGGFNTKHGETI